MEYKNCIKIYIHFSKLSKLFPCRERYVKIDLEEKRMNHSLKTGFSFGLTSGVITTLGLISGLHSGTGSKTVIIGGVLTIAIADAFSDALGIHISEESEIKHNPKEIWVSTISTFLAKFVFSSSFLVPVILLSLDSAFIASIIWGILLILIFSYILAKQQKESPFKVIGEHLLIVVVVLVVTHLTGDLISTHFK
jgi:VIT1/CCC1 family predicted Fe2+/Mn2+ transporter